MDFWRRWPHDNAPWTAFPVVKRCDTSPSSLHPSSSPASSWPARRSRAARTSRASRLPISRFASRPPRTWRSPPTPPRSAARACSISPQAPTRAVRARSLRGPSTRKAAASSSLRSRLRDRGSLRGLVQASDGDVVEDEARAGRVRPADEDVQVALPGDAQVVPRRCHMASMATALQKNVSYAKHLGRCRR